MLSLPIYSLQTKKREGEFRSRYSPVSSVSTPLLGNLPEPEINTANFGVGNAVFAKQTAVTLHIASQRRNTKDEFLHKTDNAIRTPMPASSK